MYKPTGKRSYWIRLVFLNEWKGQITEIRKKKILLLNWTPCFPALAQLSLLFPHCGPLLWFMHLFVCPISTFLSCRNELQWKIPRCLSAALLTLHHYCQLAVSPHGAERNSFHHVFKSYICKLQKTACFGLRLHKLRPWSVVITARAALQVKGFYLFIFGSLKFLDTFRPHSKWGQVKQASGVSFLIYLGTEDVEWRGCHSQHIPARFQT